MVSEIPIPFEMNSYTAQLVAKQFDQIERLRKQVAEWRDLAEEYFYLDPDCGCHLCDRMKAAMNAEQ